MPPDLAGVRDVRSAVGLQVQADDLDRADLLDARRQKVDLGPDEVRDGEGLVARQDVDAHVAGAPQLLVDLGLDLAHQVAGHGLELEVHAPGPGLHVAAGDEGAVVTPDHAAQGVEGRVGAHQGVATRPLHVHPHEVAGRRQLAVVGRFQLVDDLATDPTGRLDGPGAAVRSAQDQAAIGRLAAAARVEPGRVQDDERRPVTRGNLEDARLGRAGVRVAVADLVDPGGHRAGPVLSRRPSACRSCSGARCR